MKVKELIKELETYEQDLVVSVYIPEFSGISDNFEIDLLDVRINVHIEDAADLFGEHKEAKYGTQYNEAIEERVVLFHVN